MRMSLTMTSSTSFGMGGSTVSSPIKIGAGEGRPATVRGDEADFLRL